MKRQTDESFRELVGAIDAGTPVPIGLAPSPFSLDPAKVTRAHQVVATGYAIGEDGTKTVTIWDPNRPLDTDTTLVQTPGDSRWIEAATPGSGPQEWRGFFVESGYTTKEPPVVAPASFAAPAPAPRAPDRAEDVSGLRSGTPLGLKAS